MKSRYPNLVKILDERQPKFKCEICKQIWLPSILEGGRMSKGGFMCPNGCTKKALDMIVLTKDGIFHGR